jgi:Zn-finger protein
VPEAFEIPNMKIFWVIDRTERWVAGSEKGSVEERRRNGRCVTSCDVCQSLHEVEVIVNIHNAMVEGHTKDHITGFEKCYLQIYVKTLS